MTEGEFEEINREAERRGVTCASMMRTITFAELRRQRAERTE
jgi:hypothetical protein